MRKILKSGFVLLSLFVCQSVFADCAGLKTYASSHTSSAPAILVTAFQGDSQTAPVIAVLLREYLALNGDLSLLPLTKNDASKAAYVLSGKVTKSKGGDVMVQTSLQSNGSKKIKAGEVGHWEGSFRLNGEASTFSDMLVGLTLKITEALKEPLAEKKILPFANTTNSWEAYRAYAEGMTQLDGGDALTEASLTQAIQAFEKAVQADYNYVPGYRGLAEAYAAWAALKGPGSPGGGTTSSIGQKARVALAKAKLLNPYVTKIREDRIEWYLKNKGKDHCAP